jgi:hypothetical protein
MARDTRQLFAGLLLSVAIVAGTSATLRLSKAETTSAEGVSIVACVK